MKRVPLGAKSTSLKDILEEDMASEFTNEAGTPISDSVKIYSEIGNKISETKNQKTEKNDKSEYQKVTATLEPKLFWLLEDERRRRRMAKIEYTFSEIIREALADYFIKQGREV